MAKQQPNQTEHKQQAAVPLADKSPQALIMELEDAVSAMDDMNCDVGLIGEYLAALEGKAPLDTAFDAEASYQSFKEKNATLFDQDAVGTAVQPAARPTSADAIKKAGKSAFQRRPFRSLVAAATLLLVIFLGAFAPIANGKSFFGVLLNWGEEVFNLSRYPSSEIPDIPDMPTNGDKVYSSIEDALTAYGLDTACCPSWLPERFSLSLLDVQEDGNRLVFCAVYVDEQENNLVFSVDYDPGAKEVYYVENDASSGRIYSKDGVDYYLVTNNGLWKATWLDDTSTYSLEGLVTESELQKMIESIH